MHYYHSRRYHQHGSCRVPRGKLLLNAIKTILIYFLKVFAAVILSMIMFLVLFGGYKPHRVHLIMPLSTRVVDADTGHSIAGAQVLRIVDDFHGYRNDHAYAQMERSYSDANGHVEMDGKREWRFRPSGPGRFPVPNHKIAIWKPGYKAFVFSQYSSIYEISSCTKRVDLKKAIGEIPHNRIEYGVSDNLNKMLNEGTVKLQPDRKSEVRVGSDS